MDKRGQSTRFTFTHRVSHANMKLHVCTYTYLRSHMKLYMRMPNVDNSTFACRVSHANVNLEFFKPLPPVGAGGGYMFSGRPSVPLSVRPSVIHVPVVVLCFRDISSIC